MLGAIAGDAIGSVFEWNPVKHTDFPLFAKDCTYTDDSVLTIATADVLLHGSGYAETYRRYAGLHPKRGYGGMFAEWIRDPGLGPYNSFGNGSAMRVSPVAWAFDTEAAVLDEAARSAAVTHDHPEGIKGAQAAALAGFLALQGADKPTIKKAVSDRFGYDLDRTLAGIRPDYRFDVTCQGSVPESIIAFLESENYEDCVRKAISLGGDADTQACIAGGIAEAYYGGVPDPIAEKTRCLLPPDLLGIVDSFYTKYGKSRRSGGRNP